MSRTEASDRTQASPKKAGNAVVSAGNFRCTVVSGDDVDKAIEVRRRVYVEEFGFDLGGAVRDRFDDRSVHFLAETEEGTPVGSLRLIDETQRPFEIESFLPVDQFVTPGRHAAEITRLCIIAPHRRLSATSSVHVAILAAVLQCARDLGIAEIIASTRTELMGLYRYLLFETYPGAVYHHPEIGDSLHTLMRLDLTTLLERYERRRPSLYRALQSSTPPSRRG